MIDLPEPKLIIFDLDGTLCDTEIIWAESLSDTFSQFGPPLAVENASELYSGKTLDKVIEHYAATPGVTMPDNAFTLLYDRMTRGIAERGAKVCLEGALECFLDCAQNVPVAIATNGEHGHTQAKLDAMGIFDHAPDVKWYTKDVVDHPKPAPDLFLYVAKEFGIAPQDTWVIEDSLTGATAGVAAGMHVIGYVGCAHDKQLATKRLKEIGVKLVLESYADFPALMRQAA